MRAALALAITLAITGLAADAAMAQTGPVIAVPGRAGVPVIINGRDASYAIVESDWGLAKSVDPQPVVYGAWDQTYGKQVGRYFPSSGSLPGYGRIEIEPPADRPLPRPAESFFRSWSAESARPIEQQAIPQDPPAIIVAPEIGGQHHPHRRRR